MNYIVRHTGVAPKQPIPQENGPDLAVLQEGHVLSAKEVTELVGDIDRLVRLGAIEEAHPREVREWEARQRELLGAEIEPGAGLLDPANAPFNPDNDSLGGAQTGGLPANAGATPIVQEVPPGTSDDGSGAPAQFVPNQPPVGSAVHANAGEDGKPGPAVPVVPPAEETPATPSRRNTR